MGSVSVVKCPRCGLGNTMYLGSSSSCGSCGEPLSAPGAEPSGYASTERSTPSMPAALPVTAVKPLPDSRFRSLSRLGRFAVIGFGLVVFVNELQAAVFWQRANLIDMIEAGEPVSHADALGNDRLVNGLTLVWLLAFIAAGGVFIWWFRRAYGNLPALGVPQKYSPGWAVGAWFVPILNLFRPWKMTEEIWRGSSPDRTDDHKEDIPRPVSAWFFLLLASGAISRGSDTAETAGSLRWVVASMILSFVSGLCGIWMIQKVSERQERRSGLVSPSNP